MALRALMLKRKIDDAKKKLEDLRSKDADFDTREAELEASIEEAQTDEEKAAVEDEIAKFEEEKEQHESEKTALEEEVSGLETELEAQERKQPGVKKPEERKEEKKMENRKTTFYGMNAQERDAFFAREDVKTFLAEVRSRIGQKRAVSNVGLLIPTVMLELLKQKITETSKLISKVNLKPVAGTARQPIMGDIPEAIWTEMCAKLNELNLTFNAVEVDGYKVGGFFAICNATLEDNDVNLATEILNALGKAIGKALDKAIVYGTGTKMPLGFVTRLAQTVEPASYPATARPWVDLHTSNVITGTGKSGLALFSEIVGHAGVVVNDYAADGLTWIMNQKTHMKLIQESMDKNMNAAIVAGVSNTMPVIGGEIVELPFMADGDVAFGYLDLYLLAEREGTKIEQSEHVRFIEDQTVFKGTARYDGAPVIAEAFGIFSITSNAPATSKTFPADTAN